MDGNKSSTHQDWVDADDAPDLASKKWRTKVEEAPVQRGRPALKNPKISTTIRLDPEVLSELKSKGKGWQTRANAILREALGLS